MNGMKITWTFPEDDAITRTYPQISKLEGWMDGPELQLTPDGKMAKKSNSFRVPPGGVLEIVAA